MQQLNNISDAADQLFTIPLDDGTVLQIELFYRPAIQRWTMNLTHPLLTLNGFNLSLGPNLIRAYRTEVTFGIGLTAIDQVDPVGAQDFVSGRVSFFILSAAEVQQVEDEILNAIPLVNP